MFKAPPVFKDKPVGATLFNDALNFDESFIYCGKLNFSYEDFYEVRNQYGQENCILKNQEKIRIQKLWAQLTTDFSFQWTQKINSI